MMDVCVMRDEGVHRREREDVDEWGDEEEGGVSYFTPWRDQFLRPLNRQLRAISLFKGPRTKCGKPQTKRPPPPRAG